MKVRNDRRQKDDWSCGAIAAAVAMDLLGVPHADSSALVAAGLAATPLDGTDPRVMESFFRKLSYRVCSGEMTIEDLRHHTAMARPVLCLVRYGSVGHWVTITEVKARKLAFHCPVRGTIKMPLQAFRGIWWDSDRGGYHYHSFGVALWKD